MIDELIKNKLYKQITRNVCHNHELQDDLHCEAILVIIEKKINFDEIRNLQYFFSAVVWKTWHSNKFKKKYFQNHLEFIDNINKEEEKQNEINYSTLIEFLSKPPVNDTEYYEQNLLRLYIECGDSKKLSDKTKIPYRTVVNDIKQIKDKLKKRHNEKNSH